MDIRNAQSLRVPIFLAVIVFTIVNALIVYVYTNDKANAQERLDTNDRRIENLQTQFNSIQIQLQGVTIQTANIKESVDSIKTYLGVPKYK